MAILIGLKAFSLPCVVISTNERKQQISMLRRGTSVGQGGGGRITPVILSPSSTGTSQIRGHLHAWVCHQHVAVSSRGGSSAVENISQLPASDRAHYSRYRLTMARSLGFESRHPASPAIWALQAQGRTHTDRAKHSQRGHQECVFALFLVMCKSSEGEASVFIFLETLYMQNKP